MLLDSTEEFTRLQLHGTSYCLAPSLTFATTAQVITFLGTTVLDSPLAPSEVPKSLVLEFASTCL
jgi:hypothetical protein